MMIYFFPKIFFSPLEKTKKEKKMLECIKLGDCKIKTIQIEDEWFVSVSHICIALGVSSDILKSLERHHLPHQYKFSRK